MGKGDRASGCRPAACWTEVRARTPGGRASPAMARHCWHGHLPPTAAGVGVPAHPSPGSHPELGKAELTPGAQTEAEATAQKQDRGPASPADMGSGKTRQASAPLLRRQDQPGAAVHWSGTWCS